MHTFINRTLIKIVSFLSLMIILNFQGCLDEEKFILPSTVEFQEAVLTVVEGEKTSIYLQLERPALTAGSITIMVKTEAVYNRDFSVEPELLDGSLVVDVAKGQQFVKFEVSAINNNLLEGNKTVTFKIVDRSKILKEGTVTSCTVTLIDDEGPSLANFEVESGAVNEKNGNGIVVNIPLSVSAKGEGSITVKLDSGLAGYGTYFTTIPSLAEAVVTFTVPYETAGVSFTVLPIDNANITGDFKLSFSIASVAGAIEKGEKLSYSLTIIDDEGPSIVNFVTSSAKLAENNADGIAVKLAFSTPANDEGTIVVALDPSQAIYGTHFTTSPAPVNNVINFHVMKDQAEATITVLPIDNENFTDNFILKFSISEVTGTLEKGDSLSYSLTLADDEVLSFASFPTVLGLVNENDVQGKLVQIALTPTSTGDGTITLQVSPGQAVYGNHFTTIPAIVENTITFNVSEGQSTVSLKVLPIDNEIYSDNFTLTFTISEVTGIVKKGGNLTYSLTLDDDEGPPVYSTVDFKTTGWIYSYYEYYNIPISETEISEGNVSGVEVPILFSAPATATGSITISWHDGSTRCGINANYGTTFTTSPNGSQGSFVIPVAKGATGASFKIYPVNDDLFTDISSMIFEITEVGGTMKKGTLLNHTLRIVDDEVASIANFLGSGGMINESDASGILVEIPFSSPIPGGASITVNFNPGYGTKFTTEPSSSTGTSLSWDLNPGATGISFRVLPIDNSTCDNFSLTFTMSTCGFLKLGDWYYQKTIEDNDYATVNFAESSGSISENSTSGKVVALTFSKPISGTADIYFYTSDGGWDFNKKYTTTPPMDYDYSNGYYLHLGIQTNASESQFTVKPINNAVKLGDYNLGFTMAAGGCLRAAQNANYSLKIVDDD